MYDQREGVIEKDLILIRLNNDFGEFNYLPLLDWVVIQIPLLGLHIFFPLL